MRGPHPQSHVTFDIVVTWQIKTALSSLSQSLWTLNLAGWWLKMRRPHPQSHVTHRSSGHVTNKKRYISTFTRLADPKLSSVLTHHKWVPKSHETLQFCSHMTIWKRYISSTTSSMAPKLSRMCTQVEMLSRAKPHDTSVSWSRYKDFIFTFIFTFTLPVVCGIG